MEWLTEGEEGGVDLVSAVVHADVTFPGIVGAVVEECDKWGLMPPLHFGVQNVMSLSKRKTAKKVLR